MNEEAQRRAIAEACGWDFDPLEAQEWGSRGTWCKSPDNDELWFHCHAPDYPHDLNAMHEAEKVLEHSMRKLDYTAYLDELIGLVCANPAHPSGYATAVDATARQRAEAFLRTLGLWVEDE